MVILACKKGNGEGVNTKAWDKAEREDGQRALAKYKTIIFVLPQSSLVKYCVMTRCFYLL